MPTPLKLLPFLRGSRLAFPCAALAAFAMFVISESSYRQATSTLETLSEHNDARNNVRELRRALTDAETGQRGYLLTDRASYLQPYRDAQSVVPTVLTALKARYANDPDAGASMRSIEDATRRKLAELAETIRLHDAGDTDGWRRLIATDIGQQQMDVVRQLSVKLLAQEDAKAADERHDLRDTLLLNRLGVGALTGLCLLALFMYLRQTTELVRQREERRRLVQLERDQLERDVKLRTAHLTELARHLQSVREDERHRLARELHDELGALLTAAKLDVARLKSRLGSVGPEVAERMQHLSDGLNSGIALKRRIVEDLRPSSLSNLGLVAALDILVREWTQRNELEVDADFEVVSLTPSGELTVYRLVQEALTNISKYAKATKVVLRVIREAGEVHVWVRDDGIGFDPEAEHNSAHGLLGMRYRLESENGRLEMRSAPGEGTMIEAFLPEQPSGVVSAAADHATLP